MLNQKFLNDNIPNTYTDEEYDRLLTVLLKNFPTTLYKFLYVIRNLLLGEFSHDKYPLVISDRRGRPEKCGRARKFIILTGPYCSGKSFILNLLKEIYGKYYSNLSFSKSNPGPMDVDTFRDKLLLCEYEYMGEIDRINRWKPIITLIKEDSIFIPELFRPTEEIDISESVLLLCMSDYEYELFPEELKNLSIIIRTETTFKRGQKDTNLYGKINDLSKILLSYVLHNKHKINILY